MTKAERSTTAAILPVVVLVRLKLSTNLNSVLTFHPGEIVERGKGVEKIVAGDIIAVARIALRKLNGRKEVKLQTRETQRAAVRLRPSLVLAS